MPLDWTNWSRSIPARRDPAPTPARNGIERRWCRDAIARDADGNRLLDVGSAEAVAGSTGVFEATGWSVLTRHLSQPYNGSKSQCTPNASLASMDHQMMGISQESSMGPIIKGGRHALSSPLDQCSNLEVISDCC